MFFDRIIIVSLPLWTKLFNILIKIMNWRVYHLLQRMSLHTMKPLPEIWLLCAGFNVTSVKKSHWQTLGCQYKTSRIFPLQYIAGCSRLAAFMCVSHPAGGAFWLPAAPGWGWGGPPTSAQRQAWGSSLHYIQSCEYATSVCPHATFIFVCIFFHFRVSAEAGSVRKWSSNGAG